MLLTIEALAKSWGDTPVFRGIGLELDRGQSLALLGESGVGKSTLLNCIAALDRADAGRIVFDGVDVGALDEAGGAALRRHRMGFVFQAFHLLPHLSVHDNVALPLRLLGRTDDDRVRELLDACGLGALGSRWPSQLSGGQMQRVALARALVHRPALILADEPTGNLDPAQAARSMDLLLSLVERDGAALLMATHSGLSAARMHRRVHMQPDGLTAVD